MKPPAIDEGERFIPLPLPNSSLELQAGRQYRLCPLSRALLDEYYGLRGIPTFVTCLEAACTARKITTTCENLETGEVKTTIDHIPHRDSLFRAFYKHKRHENFSIDCAKLKELRASHAEVDVVKDLVIKYEASDESKPQKKSTRASVADIDLSLLGV